MGLLTKFFDKISAKLIVGLGVGAGVTSSRYSGDIYDQELIRPIIDCLASNAAKAEAMHVVLDKDGRIKSNLRNSPYVKLLNQQANPLMSGYDLKYRLVTQLETNTTAMCYVKWRGMTPEMLLPVDYRTAEVYMLQGGGYAVRFSDPWGEEITVNAEDVALLRKYYSNNDFFGGSNAPAYNSLSLASAADEALLDTVSANKVRGMLKQKMSQLAASDNERIVKQFQQQFKDAAASSGVLGVDASADFVPIPTSTWAVNAAQVKEIRQKALLYWRVSEPILTSNYTDSQWQAFYESVIEPILILMGQAFTNVCFTPTERAHGNRIIFASDAMNNMSMGAKTQLIATTKDLGVFTRNEYRAMFGYAPVVDGDEPLVSLNYVKASEQSQYQGTGTEPDTTPAAPDGGGTETTEE